jgi:hypothetical protein
MSWSQLTSCNWVDADLISLKLFGCLLYYKAHTNFVAGVWDLAGMLSQVGLFLSYIPCTYLELPMEWSQLDLTWVDTDLAWWQSLRLMYCKAPINFVVGLGL